MPRSSPVPWSALNPTEPTAIHHYNPSLPAQKQKHKNPNPALENICTKQLMCLIK